MNLYKFFYKLMGLLIGLCAFVVRVYALELAISANESVFLSQAAGLSILASCIALYRFLYGRKRGHLIIFSYLILAFVINIEAYVATTGGLDWIAGPLMTTLAAMTVIVLDSILRLTVGSRKFTYSFDKQFWVGALPFLHGFNGGAVVQSLLWNMLIVEHGIARERGT